MKRKTLLSVRFVLMVAIVLASSARATMVDGEYQGDWYGVRVKLPPQIPFCGGDDPPNNGVVLFLGRQTVDCDTVDQETARTITLFGLPNSGEDAEIMALDAAYKYECRLFSGCTGAHPEINVKDRHVRTGVIKHNPARIFVLFQQGDARVNGVDVHNTYNITVTLQTDVAHQAEDMKVMKKFVASLHLFTPTN
ncbi:hypothetical protein [Pinirhizobacter soli]|uniref:hypothetical protein n=1 Tax=Pinirhizobacter soli TaxID=2786953 RepID=UPI00202A150C|nr:hypothetical protein [Pinirhizobacter soli]